MALRRHGFQGSHAQTGPAARPQLSHWWALSLNSPALSTSGGLALPSGTGGLVLWVHRRMLSGHVTLEFASRVTVLCPGTSRGPQAIRDYKVQLLCVSLRKNGGLMGGSFQRLLHDTRTLRGLPCALGTSNKAVRGSLETPH